MRDSNGLKLWFLMVVLAATFSVAVAQTTSVSPGQKLKVEGIIVERSADGFKLRQSTGTDLTVKISGATNIREKKHNPFRGARKYQQAQLARGLSVNVEGRGDSDGVLVAEQIRFTHDEYKVAEAIDSRTSPLEDNARRMSGQIDELDAISNAAKGGAKAAQETADNAHGRITALDDYDVVHSTSVRFKVGSAVLSPEAKSALDKLAEETHSQKGFVIEVAGFASAEGGAELNQRLSRQRSQAVAEYLFQKHDIPLRRILTPAGYGVSHAVADNSTRAGREENRRAEVRILVSKGMTANTQKPTGGGASAQLNRPETKNE